MAKTAYATTRREADILIWIYDSLRSEYGPQNWWPADSAFEVCVGAILTQAVTWKQVEEAIAALRREALLSPKAILEAPTDQLARLLRPTRYFNQKAETLQGFCRYLVEEYEGDLSSLFARPTENARRELLALRGIGPETADSILLYAGGHPVFVVDAYTRRLLVRIGVVGPKASYTMLQGLFQSALPLDVALYNEYHALIVAHGKARCTARKPVCVGCPLVERCSFGLQQESIL